MWYDELEAMGMIEASILRSTKIHKVVEAVPTLEVIPRDKEYQIRNRSLALVGRWENVLAGNQYRQRRPRHWMVLGPPS